MDLRAVEKERDESAIAGRPHFSNVKIQAQNGGIP